MSAEELCDAFGVSKSTGSAKSKVLRDTLNMMQMDPNWYLPSKMDDNPMAWMITVKGFLVDARKMSPEVLIERKFILLEEIFYESKEDKIITW